MGMKLASPRRRRVIVAIIVIIIAAVVTIRSRSIILRFDKHTILDAGPRDMTVA